MILYIILTYIVKVLLYVLGLFFSKIRDYNSHVERSFDSIPELEDQSEAIRFWFHAASLGEADQASALALKMKSMNPKVLIILSYTSSSINPNKLQEKGFDYWCRLPLDTYFIYNRYFRKFKPKGLILFAWDTWPNLIYSAKQRKIPSYLVCGSLHPGSSRVVGLGKWVGKLGFQNLSGVYPTSGDHLDLYKEFISKECDLEVLGDTRFDSVSEKINLQKSSQEFEKWANSKKENKIIVLASTYTQCEELFFPRLAELIERNFEIWIFPSSVDPGRIHSLNSNLERYKIPYENYPNSKRQSVTIFPLVGILAFAYRYAWACYVGGGLHNRSHNTMEPAVWGLPILCGSKINHASEAVALKELGGLITIESTSQAIDTLLLWERDIDRYHFLQKVNREFILGHLGASQKIAEKIFRNCGIN